MTRTEVASPLVCLFLQIGGPHRAVGFWSLHGITEPNQIMHPLSVLDPWVQELLRRGGRKVLVGKIQSWTPMGA